MTLLPSFSFKQELSGKQAIVAACCGEDLTLPPNLCAKYEGIQSLFEKGAKIKGFEGKHKSHIELIAPLHGPDRLLVFGCPKGDAGEAKDWMAFGGYAAGVLEHASASVVFPAVSAGQLCAFAEGFYLRSYKFNKYKTAKADKKEQKQQKPAKLALIGGNAAQAKKLWREAHGVAQGVCFARDLVNEPTNVLTTKAFAKRLQALSELGVEVEVFDETQLSKMGMRALLAVGQASDMPSQVAVMHWRGGKQDSQPVVLIGKGVVFDTGGISLKPANGMEEMKADMGGAASVAGLMHAVAARKAKANVVGVVGLVENMPGGKAQRPGDVLTSLSGQTIEVINTDAEGRLVLADLLWYAEERFKPRAMVNLATLTGAILVALGQHHAGLFSNADKLAEQLIKAGLATDELVWRMPLGKAYDKMIDSKIADMKNVGGRWAGSITAAQFLQRFVREVDWAHLDIAGMAMGLPKSQINHSWGSGFGVRLLDRLIADYYEN